MNRPNRLDWIVYSIFRWWWNPIFVVRPWLALGIETEFKRWRERNYPDLKENMEAKCNGNGML